MQHALTFSADTSAVVDVGEASSVEAEGLEVDVRKVQAMTFESNSKL